MSRKYIYFSLLGLISIVSLFSISFFASSVNKILAQNNLLPKPETFTELYFNEHTSLPSKVVPEEQYSFSFTVNNVEYKDMIYPYEVYIEHDDEKIATITKKTIFISKDQSKTIRVDFVAPEFATKAAVVVNLVNKKQKIHFWIYE